MRKDDDRFAEAEQLWEDGEFKKAMAIYNDILADESIPLMARAIVCEYIGRLYIGMGNVLTGEKYLTRAVEMDPEGVEHHVQLANCLCLAGRNEDAWRMIRQLYDRYPEHPVVIHYVGKMLDERGYHEKGLQLMKKAISLDPTNERFLADLSFTYMMHGNAGAAVVCSEEAMTLNPNDDVVRFIHEVATEFERQELERQQTAQSRRPQPPRRRRHSNKTKSSAT